MKESKKEKERQLGMNPGTAQHILRKSIIFMMAKKLTMDFCFQCGSKIESVDELSVEHKVPWLHSEDPIKLFFDIDNIAFSHLSCNRNAARTSTGSKEYYESIAKSIVESGEKQCTRCKITKPLSAFSKSSRTKSNCKHFCKDCRKLEGNVMGY